MHRAPQSPCVSPAQLKPAKVGNGGFTSDRLHSPNMLLLKSGRRRLIIKSRTDGTRDKLPALFGSVCKARKRTAVPGGDVYRMSDGIQVG